MRCPPRWFGGTGTLHAVVCRPRARGAWHWCLDGLYKCGSELARRGRTVRPCSAVVGHHARVHSSANSPPIITMCRLAWDPKLCAGLIYLGVVELCSCAPPFQAVNVVWLRRGWHWWGLTWLATGHTCRPMPGIALSLANWPRGTHTHGWAMALALGGAATTTCTWLVLQSLGLHPDPRHLPSRGVWVVVAQLDPTAVQPPCANPCRPDLDPPLSLVGRCISGNWPTCRHHRCP